MKYSILFRTALVSLAIVAVLLGAFISVGGNVPRASACTLVDPKTGDLNADGLTNSLDALSVDFYVAKLMKPPSTVWLAGADVNCDTTVDAVDGELILQVDAGLYQIRP